MCCLEMLEQTMKELIQDLEQPDQIYIRMEYFNIWGRLLKQDRSSFPLVFWPAVGKPTINLVLELSGKRA